MRYRPLCAGAAIASALAVAVLLWQGMLEDKAAELRAAQESPDVPEADEEGKPLTKKARKELLRAAEKEREKRTAAESQRIDPEARPPPAASALCLPSTPQAGVTF